MENSLKSSGGCSSDIPKKKKCLDLQTIYNSKGLEEESIEQRKCGKKIEGKVGDANRNKSVKEFPLDRIDQGGKKRRKVSDEGDGSHLGPRFATVMNGGLSGICYKNGLNSVPLSFGGNGNILSIPKRPRCTTSRRKFEGDRNDKVSGSSSMIFHFGRLNAELRKAESSGSSGAEAGLDTRGVELTTDSVEVGGSKVQGKRAVSDVKESSNEGEPSAQYDEECSHVVASNGDVPYRKRRSTFRKRKDLASVGVPSVVKVEPTVDYSGNTSEGLGNRKGFHLVAYNGDVSPGKRISKFRKSQDLASVGEPSVKKDEPTVDNSGNVSNGLRDKEGFHDVANNGDVFSRMRRSNVKKRKDLALVGEPSVKMVEPTVDNSSNTYDGLGDREGFHIGATNGDASSRKRRSKFRKGKDFASVGEPSLKKVERAVDNSGNISDCLVGKEEFHDAANNGDVFSRKRRSNGRKRKDLALVGGHIGKKVEPSLDNSGNLLEGLRDEDNDEENLEQNAAMMLSSRFDPRCTVFSSESNSTRPFQNGVAVSGPEFVCSRPDSLAGVELESVDAANRILRPRKQRSQKRKPRKRRHFYEIVASNFDAHWFLDRKIKVFWPLDEIWYYGLVNNYDPETKLHHVKYDDRDEEWIDLQREKFKLLLLPSEVPGRRRRRRASMNEKCELQCQAHSNADDDSSAGTFLDSEPIISWLVRTSRRIKSNSFKKQKTFQMSSFAGPSLAPIETTVDTNSDMDAAAEDKSKSDCASALSDRSIDGNVSPSAKNGSKSYCVSALPDRSIDADPLAENVSKLDCCASALPDRSTDGERIENSLMGSPSSSTATNCIVYVRKRFHNKREVSNMPKSFSSQLGTFVTLAPDKSLLTAVKSNNILWSTDDQGLIKLAISATECTTLSFELSSNVFPFFENLFKAKQSWLSHALLLPYYGTMISAWPDVVLEILFVDNTVGLRFLLFEGRLKDVILLFSLILTVFNEPHGDWIFFETRLPITSIRFKLSAKHDRWKEQVFTFYNFSTLRSSKWLYLDSKLQRHCVFNKKLPLSDCTYDNLKSLEGGSHQLHMPCPNAKPSRFEKRSIQSILPVGVPRENASTRTCQSAFGSAIQLTKFPAFAVSFTAAPTFFLSRHLKLLMDNAIASVSLQENTLCLSEEAGVAIPPFSAVYRGDDICSENAHCPIVPGIFSSETLKVKIPEIVASYAETHPRIELVAGTDDKIQIPQEIACVRSAIDMSVSTGSMDFEKKATDTPTIKPCRQNLDEQGLGQIVVALSAPASKAVSSPDSVSKTNYYGLAGMNVQLPCFYASDKASDRGTNISDVQQNPNLTRFSSSMFHDSIVQSSNYCGDLSPIWRDGRSTLIQGGFSNGPKKPRTQVQYSLPLGGYHPGSNHKMHNQTATFYKRIRRSNKRRICEGFRDSKKNIESLACDANVLVSLRERGWRECGARVVLAVIDHNEWTLAVKVSGITKYSHKVSQILQPGSTNRYTHAMMWKGGKDWMLEFPDRSQWVLFKQIYEECHNRNIRAASVKNIPIPGVRLIEESGDCENEPLFVQHSPRYFHQLESDVEMALNPSRVFYDMDSDDEQWISVTRNSSSSDENSRKEISDELFEKTMDMLEKFAYTQRRDEFTDEELEELVPGFHSIEILKAIYQHWQQKRRRKGQPLIRHFQAPLWEQYEQQVKHWEEASAKSNTGACNEKTVSMEKPPTFAFCLKPRGLEVISRGSKQRSHRRFTSYGHYQSIPVDQDGLHSHGRRLNGFNEEKIVFTDRSNEFPDTSPSFNNLFRSLSPEDGDFFESNHHPKFNKNKQRKNGVLASLNNSEILVPYNQNTSGMRNGVHRLDMDRPELPNQKTIQRHEGLLGLLDSSDCYEFRLIDAKGEAQQARKVAKMKRERAQRLLYRADLAIHKATVALMTAEAIKASFDT